MDVPATIFEACELPPRIRPRLSRETAALHDAIVVLRRAGFRICRTGRRAIGRLNCEAGQGNIHIVNGSLRTSLQLIEMARTVANIQRSAPVHASLHPTSPSPKNRRSGNRPGVKLDTAQGHSRGARNQG